MSTIDGKLYEELCATTATAVTGGGNVGAQSPLRAATTSPTTYTTVGEVAGTDTGLFGSPPCPGNVVSISSVSRWSAQGRPYPGERSAAGWPATPQLAQASPTLRTLTEGDDNLMAELSRLLADTDPQAAVERRPGEGQGPQPGPFGLALESPAISRPSIELPPTLSRLPSAKKPVRSHSTLLSSQESVFVAGTQFPILLSDRADAGGRASLSSRDRAISTDTVLSRLGNLSSVVDVPPTQYPAAPECSQALDLFDQGTDGTAAHLETTEVLFPSSNLEDPAIKDQPHNPRTVGLQEGEAQAAEWGEENPFLASTIHRPPTSAMKKTTTPRGAASRRVQFAPTLNPRSEDGLSQASDKLGSLIALPELPMDSRTLPPLLPSAAVRPPPERVHDGEEAPACQSLPRSNSHQGLPHRLSSTLQVEVDGSTVRGPAPSSPLPARRSLVVEEVGSHLQLGEHVLVWAKWKYQYYAPAILHSRPSRTRDLWKVRFAHWRGWSGGEPASSAVSTSSGRTVCLPVEQMVPLAGQPGLDAGQAVWIVRNRKKMQLTEGRFIQWHGPGKVRVGLGDAHDRCEEETVELQRILVDHPTFVQLRVRATLSPPSVSSQPTGAAEPPSSLAPPPSSEVALGKRTLPRPTPRKGKLLAGYTVWISLGGGLSDTAKRIQKSHLVTRIKALGGTTIARQAKGQGASLDKDYTRTVLLTNGHYRLAKIYLALILGISIVRLEWLESCEQTGSLAPPTAFVIPIPQDKPVASDLRRGLLATWCLAIEGSRQFQASWTPVCRAAGATICTTGGGVMRTEGGQLRILVEKLPPRNSRLARTVKETGIIVVTVDWLMQSILTGRVF